MLGLVYPAVLGNFLFLVLQAVQRTLGGEAPTALKVGLLLTTLAFYICDFLYITFTVRFVWYFFALDAIFLVLLFFTVVNIHVTDSSQPALLPILGFYCLFMVLYYVWDRLEGAHFPSGSPRTYRLILSWEVVSTLALLALSAWHRWRSALPRTSLAALVVITACFGVIVAFKRHEHPEAASTSQLAA